MTRALRKTGARIRRFFGDALAWRAPDRQYGVVAWGLIAGAIWFAAGLAGTPDGHSRPWPVAVSWPY